MVFSAYRLAEDTAAFVHVPRAGAAPFVLYRMAFALATPDHLTLVWVNTACALALLVVVPALAARWRTPPGTCALTAWLVALTPVFVVDGRTESPLVPALLWLLVGLLLLDEALQTGRRRWLAGAVTLLALAAQSRPELVAVAPSLAVAAAWRHPLPAGWLRKAAVAAFGWLALCLPHLLHLQRAVALEQAAGSVPELGATFWLGVPDRLVGLALPLQGDLFPLATTAVAAGGFFVPGDRRFRAAIVTVAVGWMALTVVDLPRTSVPRLHAGAALLLTVAAAWVACGWLQRQPPKRAVLLALGLGAAWIVTAVPGAPTLLARTNEDDTEQFLREAVAALPAVGACVVAIDMGDLPPAHRTQRAFPAYLLRPPHREATLYGLDGWRRAGQPACAAGTFLVVDHRCYAMHADGRAAGITTKPMLDSCGEVLRSHRWSTVLQRTVPNRGDNEYGYYGSVPEFPLAMYRLEGP